MNLSHNLQVASFPLRIPDLNSRKVNLNHCQQVFVYPQMHPGDLSLGRLGVKQKTKKEKKVAKDPNKPKRPVEKIRYEDEAKVNLSKAFSSSLNLYDDAAPTSAFDSPSPPKSGGKEETKMNSTKAISSSVTVNDDAPTFSGIADFGSPSSPPPQSQLIADIPYGYQSDIWSLGCSLVEIVAHQPAYRDRVINQSSISPLPTVYSSTLKRLIKSMLQKMPELRPTIVVALLIASQFRTSDHGEFSKPIGNASRSVSTLTKDWRKDQSLSQW
ncbi:hypothetical protein AgCh_008453 [Apium graveolens]